MRRCPSSIGSNIPRKSPIGHIRDQAAGATGSSAPASNATIPVSEVHGSPCDWPLDWRSTRAAAANSGSRDYAHILIRGAVMAMLVVIVHHILRALQ